MHKTKKGLSSARRVGAKTSVLFRSMKPKNAHIQKAQVLFIQSKTR